MIHRLLFVACFCASLLSVNAFCEADVVDDSENFALLEEQQADYEPPVAHDNTPSYNNNSNNSYHAFAQDDKPLAKDDRHTNTNSAPELLEKVMGLQQEVQELRGQLELQAHELKLLQEQTLSFYKDLDARLRGSDTTLPAKNISPAPTNLDAANQISSPSQTAVPAPAPAITINQQGANNPADEQIRYLAAYELVKKKQFDSALLDMQAFIAKYPHGGYSANAHYWLGELYMVKNNYPSAIEHFTVVMQEFPKSSKSAASLLKTGYALAASGKITEARNVLQDVIKKYPDTATAKLASKKLNSLPVQ